MKVFALLLITLMCVSVMAMTDDAVPLTDANKYHLQAVKAQANFEQLWMQNAINTIIEGNQQLKQHRDLANQKAQEYQALEDKLWADSKLSKSDYLLDDERGQFTKIAKKDGQ